MMLLSGINKLDVEFFKWKGESSSAAMFTIPCTASLLKSLIKTNSY